MRATIIPFCFELPDNVHIPGRAAGFYTLHIAAVYYFPIASLASIWASWRRLAMTLGTGFGGVCRAGVGCALLGRRRHVITTQRTYTNGAMEALRAVGAV